MKIPRYYLFLYFIKHERINKDNNETLKSLPVDPDKISIEITPKIVNPIKPNDKMILLNSSNNRKSNKIEKDIKVDEQSEKSSRSQSVKSKKDQSEKSEKSQSVKSEKSQSVKSEKRKSVKSEKRQSEHQSKELNDKIIAEKPAEIEHDKDDHNKTNEGKVYL